jgi:NADH dehydrogenase
MAKHAVTGAFGFSGKYLAKHLLQAGEEVITLTNSPDRLNPFDGRVKAFPFVFDEPSEMAKNLSGVDVLYNTYWVRFNHVTFTHSGAVYNTNALFEAAKLAGVRRIVHVSITNADEESTLEYFRGKGELEQSLKESGLAYSIVRPAVLFGEEDILINNIAWALRRFPVFPVFGDGSYHIQPIYVDDMEKLMMREGFEKENREIYAVGAEDYTYLELVEMIREELGLRRKIICVPPFLCYLASVLIGKIKGDKFVTKEEIKGLMADLLHAPEEPACGATLLSEYIRENKASVGKLYHGELVRRKNRKAAY